MTKKSKSAPKVYPSKNKINMSLVALLVFIVGCSVVGAYLIFGASAAPKNSNTTTASVTLSMQTSATRVAVGTVVPVTIKLDTAGKSVNAVEADVTYPADTFEFVSIDTTSSAFGIEVPSNTDLGSVKIARGSISAIKGSNVTIATINLRAIASTRKANVVFSNTSQVMSTPDAVNVLAKTTGLQFTVQ